MKNNGNCGIFLFCLFAALALGGVIITRPTPPATPPPAENPLYQIDWCRDAIVEKVEQAKIELQKADVEHRYWNRKLQCYEQMHSNRACSTSEYTDVKRQLDLAILQFRWCEHRVKELEACLKAAITQEGRPIISVPIPIGAQKIRVRQS